MNPFDLREAFRTLPVLTGLTPATTYEEAAAGFRALGEFDGSSTVLVSRFEGTSPWERHPAGDEMIYIVEGETELTVIGVDGSPTQHRLTVGAGIVVPKNVWHRFVATQPVSVLSLTPGATDIHAALEPPPD